MTVASNGLDHSCGRLTDAQTPSGATAAVVAPSGIATFQLTSPWRPELIVPDTAAGTMATSDSALAVRSLTPMRMRIGTARMPPPTPRRPAANPINAPMASSETTDAGDHSRCASRSGIVTKTMAAVTASIPMKIHRTRETFHVRKARAPRGARAAAPIAMTNPKPNWLTGTNPDPRYTDAAIAAVGMMAARLVADAARCGSPAARTRSGTMMIPPPIPNIPDKNPATTPIARMTGRRGVGVGTKASLTAGNRMGE